MKLNSSGRSKLAQFLVGAAMVIALMAARAAIADGEHEHLVTDWSHRYVVYSAPQSMMQRIQLSGDRRYADQLRRRESQRLRVDKDEWRWRRAPEGPRHIEGDWSMDMGAGATVGAGNYPAKFSFDTTSASCASASQPDFVVYNTGLAGSAGLGGQADIVAFDNLYSSCTAPTPQTYWAYSTGLGGAVVTSPVLSRDGTQVAFIENTSPATLVVLRWAANSGTLASPATPTTEAPGNCAVSNAPCMTTITFSTANGDTTATDSFSSPFYDYLGDALYVGDTSGFLHKFTGVFLGTPTEVVCTASTVTAGCAPPAGTELWPANLIGGPFGHLNSPVLIPSVNQVMVTGSDGVLYTVAVTGGGASSMTLNASAKLANTGFDDGPLVDGTTGTVYVFARADTNATAANVRAAVFQFPVPANPMAFHNATGTEAIVSNTATAPASAFYIGAFNDAYYSSGTGTGDLLVCSTSGTVNALWDIHINLGTMGAPVEGPSLTTANVACSPITEFINGATDRMFLSVAGSAVTAAPVNCPSNTTGCLMSFDISSLATWGTLTPTAAVTSVTGGTSGIVIDNSSAAGGASQIYFTPLADQPCAGSGGVGNGTGGCAIQASQSGLM